MRPPVYYTVPLTSRLGIWMWIAQTFFSSQTWQSFARGRTWRELLWAHPPERRSWAFPPLAYVRAWWYWRYFGEPASRSEWWGFTAIHLGGSLSLARYTATPHWLIAIYLVLAILPWLALTARRLIDTGRSPWLAALAFMPWANIALLVLCSLPPTDVGRSIGRYVAPLHRY